MVNEIRLYQIYYLKNQLKYLSDNIIPYDNSNDKSKLCEYGIFMKEYKNFSQYNEKYIGFISWKFSIKTKKSPNDFCKFILDNPGYDLYAIQPFPISRFSNGFWDQGNKAVPPCGSMFDIVEILSRELGIKSIVDQERQFDKIITCNYWAAEKEVWHDYMEFTLPIAKFLISKIIENPTWAKMFPYIMERLITSFLIQNKKIKTKVWHLADDLVL